MTVSILVLLLEFSWILISSKTMWDFRLPPRSSWELRSSGVLRSV